MRFLRKAALFVAVTFVLSLGATPAFSTVGGLGCGPGAICKSLTGNARYQIGNGLPIPITLTTPPTGDVNATPGAKVGFTGNGGIRFGKISVLTHPGTKRTQGVFPANTAVFQVGTAIEVGFPGRPGTLRPGGRSGPQTVTWCPGTETPVAGAPGCGVFPMGGDIPGGVIYNGSAAQFGGALPGRLEGLATVALVVAGNPPGNVTAINAFASPNGLGQIGATFNDIGTTVADVPTAGEGFFNGTVNAAGSFTNVVASGLGSGVSNGATSYGAPWTTATITVQNTAATPNETFVLAGSNALTAGGNGTISFVSSSISARVLSGPNANRGWLNLTLSGSPPVPSVTPGGIAAIVGLVALVGGYALTRRQARAAA